jgi:hypothetical protein
MVSILVCVLFFAGAAAAQTTFVLPPSHAAREGSSFTNVPLGRSTAMRTQLAYDGALFPRAGLIESLALRVDGGQTAAAKQVEIGVRACTGPISVLALQATFAQNVGADDREVFARRVLALPAHTSPQTPNPFTVLIPFDVPFPYDPRNGAVVFDVTVFDQPPGAYPLDLTYVCDSPLQRYGPAGCGPAGALPLQVNAMTTQIMWGQTFDLAVNQARPNSVAGLFLGSIEQGSWAGITLPFDLGVAGAPGCHLSIDMLFTTFARANASGIATFPFTIPGRPELVGTMIRFQGFDVDPAANALGVTTSQPGKVTVCGWERVGRVWASGLAATVGTREVGLAPPVAIGLR